MFLAIINDSYVEVKTYTLGTTRQMELVEYTRKVPIKYLTNHLTVFFQKIYQFLGIVHLANNPKNVKPTSNYLEWRESLIK